MVDLLLIHPPKYDYGKSVFKNFDTYSFLSNIAPLGLLYVAASCKNRRYSVKVLDMESEKISLDNIKRYLKLYLPRAVGITVTAAVIKSLMRLSRIIKKEINIPIIVGGPCPSLYPDSILNNKYVDFVIRYEGEESLPELLSFLFRGEGKLEGIKNLSYRLNGRIIHNELNALKQDIDSLPFPARELLPIESYFSILTEKIPSIGIFGSRGCPYRCIFCSSVYKTSRYRSVENVVDEIEAVIKKYNIKNFDFFDPVFNLNNKWVVDLCDEILQRKLDIIWRARCRPDLIKEYPVIKMKEAGCKIISLSIESANNDTLSFLKKGYTIGDVIRAIEIIKSAKMDIHSYFILGSPNETRSDMLNTIKFAKKTKIDYADFHILTPFVGSELFENVIGGRANIEYSFGDDIVLNHPTLSQRDIKKIYLKALSSFYQRPLWIAMELNKFIQGPKKYLKIIHYLIVSIMRVYKNRLGFLLG